MSKYAFELYSKNGLLLADLTGLAEDRSIVESRNRPEEIDFSLDLVRFEQYTRSIGGDASQILIAGQTELRVKRNGTYLCGARIERIDTTISSRSKKIQVKALGYLNMFAKRRTGGFNTGLVAERYENMTRADILWQLIEQTQAIDDGDLGITKGSEQYTAAQGAGLYEKTYNLTVIKEAIQNMTELKTGPIDIKFTHDKKFNTYQSLGSSRPDIVFEYPKNILEINLPDDAINITNEVKGIGSGIGDDAQTILTVTHLESAANYGTRQETLIKNDTNNEDNGLLDAVEAKLDADINPYRIPSLVVDGNLAPYVTDYQVGDTVVCKIVGFDMLKRINGMYRLERRTIRIDNDDNEIVTLEVDV